MSVRKEENERLKKQGAHLKKLMKQRGLDRNELLEILHEDYGRTLRPQSVTNYCAGRTQIKADTAADLADLFNVSVDYIIGKAEYASISEEFIADISEFLNENERSKKEMRAFRLLFNRYGLSCNPSYGYDLDDNGIMTVRFGKETMYCTEDLYNQMVRDCYSYIEMKVQRFKEDCEKYNTDPEMFELHGEMKRLRSLREKLEKREFIPDPSESTKERKEKKQKNTDLIKKSILQNKGLTDPDPK